MTSIVPKIRDESRAEIDAVMSDSVKRFRPAEKTLPDVSHTNSYQFFRSGILRTARPDIYLFYQLPPIDGKYYGPGISRAYGTISKETIQIEEGNGTGIQIQQQ